MGLRSKCKRMAKEAITNAVAKAEAGGSTINSTTGPQDPARLTRHRWRRRSRLTSGTWFGTIEAVDFARELTASLSILLRMTIDSAELSYGVTRSGTTAAAVDNANNCSK